MTVSAVGPRRRVTAPAWSPRPAHRWQPPGRRQLRRPVGVASLEVAAPLTVAQRRERLVLKIVAVCGVGYLVIGRPFAYIGVSSASLFLGEVSLAASFFYSGTRALWRQVPLMLRRAGPLHFIAWLVLAQLLLGLGETIRGLALGRDLIYTLRNLPFNYLPLFIVPGLWAGSRDSALLRRILLAAAWTDATYGVLQVVLLSRLHTTFPGQPGVPLFDLAPTSGLLVVALLGMNPRPRFFAALAGLDAFAMLGHQERAEWLAFIGALLVWLFLTRRIRIAVIGIVAVVGVLGIISLSGLKVAGAGGRGGQVSFGGVAGRVIAPFAPAESAKLLGKTDAKTFASTASWRTQWWHAINKSVRADPVFLTAGHGYGYNLAQLNPEGVGPEVRTPHDVYYYALGYTGYLGVLLFFSMLLAIAMALWRVWQKTRVATGLLVVTFMLGLGLLGDWFETPFGGVPTYLLLGIALAPLITPRAPVVELSATEEKERTPGLHAADDSDDEDDDGDAVNALRTRRLDRRDESEPAR